MTANPDNHMKIIVKHACGHYEIHVLTTRDDREAAQIEARLEKQPCTQCKGKEVNK